MKKLLPLWLIAGVLLSGCETKETLVGRWQGPRDQPDLKRAQPVSLSGGVRQQVEKPLFQAEFFENGTFIISAAPPDGIKKSLEGRYQLSGSRVELRVTDRVESGMHYAVDGYEPDQLSIKGSLKENRLSLNDDFGLVMDLFSKRLAEIHRIRKEHGYSPPMDFEKVN